LRVMVLPSEVVKEVPPSGPPVPARVEVGSLESGQPARVRVGVGEWARAIGLG
jgi:hypothetical protein